MNMNFSLAFERLEGAGVNASAKRSSGMTDQLEAETKEFIESLATDVRRMGWSPVVTTHTSDYFPVFYAMALELIDKGKAYASVTSRRRRLRLVEVSRARVALKAMQDPPAELVKEAKLDQPSA